MELLKMADSSSLLVDPASTATSSIAIRRRKAIILSTALFLLGVFYVVQNYSLAIVSSAAEIHRGFELSSYVFLDSSPQSQLLHRSLFSSEQQCDSGTLSVLMESRSSHSDSTNSAAQDVSLDFRKGNLRQSKSAIQLDIAKLGGAHKFNAVIPIDRRSKNQFCLHFNSEYIFTLKSSSDVSKLSDSRLRVCGETFSGTVNNIVVRTNSERCYAKEAPIVANQYPSVDKKLSTAAVDCTEEPTSAPTSMPTRFIDPNAIPGGNSTSNGNSQQIYESTTFISTVSAVGGTTVVATVGGVAYAAARSAKYFVQVPFAPEDLAMQI